MQKSKNTQKVEIIFKKYLIFKELCDIITITVHMPIWQDRKISEQSSASSRMNVRS
jgi:hypothetical protein